MGKKFREMKKAKNLPSRELNPGLPIRSQVSIPSHQWDTRNIMNNFIKLLIQRKLIWAKLFSMSQWKFPKKVNFLSLACKAQECIQNCEVNEFIWLPRPVVWIWPPRKLVTMSVTTSLPKLYKNGEIFSSVVPHATCSVVKWNLLNSEKLQCCT